MKVIIPEKNKKAGICYTLSEEGVEHPVIDITHPTFALPRWTRPQRAWRRPPSEALAADPVMATSWGLGPLEYGSDDEIVANLEALHGLSYPNGFVMGSVTRDGGPARVLEDSSRVSTRPRSREAFTALAASAAWRVAEVVERSLCRNLGLARASW